MHRSVSIVLVLATLGSGAALAAEPAKTQVMLVATYHFSNPGKDLNNVRAVDVRGGEIDALMAFGAKEVAHISALQDKTSIGGVLHDLNADASIERNRSFYPRMLSYLAGTW